VPSFVPSKDNGTLDCLSGVAAVDLAENTHPSKNDHVFRDDLRVAFSAMVDV
jgi:hypothetical protein